VPEHRELSRNHTCISTRQPLAEHVTLVHEHQLQLRQRQYNLFYTKVLTNEASHNTTYTRRYAVKMCDSRCIQQLVLSEVNITMTLHSLEQHTGIFFWVMTTEVSKPLTDTAVWPEPEIALNAYSNGGAA